MRGGESRRQGRERMSSSPCVRVPEARQGWSLVPGPLKKPRELVWRRRRRRKEEEEELRKGPQDLSFPQPRRLAGGITLEIQGESLLLPSLRQSEGQGRQMGQYRVGKTGEGKRKESSVEDTGNEGEGVRDGRRILRAEEQGWGVPRMSMRS